MAKASIVAARQAQAMEDQAKFLAEVIERLERIEKKLDEAIAKQVQPAKKEAAR
jgi:hypothetical protein